MAVDSAKVKELREKTGLPMMECKKALEKTGSDIDKAFEELRKAGFKAQEKLAGRAAKEGRIGSYLSPDKKVGVLVVLRCETEPVSKNEEYQKLLAGLVEVILKGKPKDRAELEGLKLPWGKTVAEAVTDLVNKIRENISVGAFARFEADAIGQYVHFDQKKGAMVALKGATAESPKVAELGKELGMHVVFAKPASLSRDKLDKAFVDKEREILLAAAKNDPKNAKKPEEILKKIVEGQVDKFVASKCLLEQPFVRDEKQTVSQYLKGSGAGVTVENYIYLATDLA